MLVINTKVNEYHLSEKAMEVQNRVSYPILFETHNCISKVLLPRNKLILNLIRNTTFLNRSNKL